MASEELPDETRAKVTMCIADMLGKNTDFCEANNLIFDNPNPRELAEYLGVRAPGWKPSTEEEEEEEKEGLNRQKLIGLYIIARDGSGDPIQFSKDVAERCGGRNDFTALDRFLGFVPGSPAPIDFSNYEYIGAAMAAHNDAVSSGGRKKKSKRTTRKKGKKYKKQKGGVFGIRRAHVAYPLTLLIMGLGLIAGLEASKSMGGPDSIPAISKLVTELMVQANMLNPTCGSSTEVGGRMFLSLVGMAESCSDLALSNEQRLGQLTTYVSTMVGMGLGAGGLASFNNIYRLVDSLLEYIQTKCSRAALRFSAPVNEAELVKAQEEIEDWPNLSVLNPGSRDSEVQQGKAILKGLLQYTINNIRASIITPDQVIRAITNIEAGDPQSKNYNYQAFTRIISQDLAGALDSITDTSGKTIYDAFIEDKQARLKPLLTLCSKNPGCQTDKQVRERQRAAEQEEARRSTPKTTLSQFALAPEDEKESGSPKMSRNTALRLLATRDSADEGQARREEQARQEVARREAEQLAAQQEAERVEAEQAAQQQVTDRAAARIATAAQREAEGETKSDETAVPGDKRQREGGRRRRRTSKAKKHHRKGKKAHKSRKGRKGKKANRKTKKHHKKAKKAHRKSRKH